MTLNVYRRRSSRVRVHGNFGQRGNYETREYCESPRKDEIKKLKTILIKTLECVMMAATNRSSLNKSETDFLEENLEHYSVENKYFLGYLDGKRDEFEVMLERFLLSFTCFVKKALHSKELNHKRLSKNGRQFLSFLADFFASISSVWAL